MGEQFVDGDRSEALADSVLKAWQQLCTPRGGNLDEALHILQSICIWSSDRCPAAMKAAKILRGQHCSRLEWINKDPAHALRSVTSLITESFAETEDVLFADKTAVIPRITNSCEWKAKFVWLEEVVQKHPNFTGALKTAVRHFGWAQTRWESSAGPRRRLCHLLVPTALLLAVTAADARTESKEKKRHH